MPRSTGRIRQRIVRWLTRRVFSSLAGVSCGDWLRLVRDNGYVIDPAHLPRALLLTLTSLPNAVDRWREERNFGAAVRAVTVPPPLFILGHWRTGTTHLHNLLAADPQFNAPNLYQVFNPHTLLCNEARLARFIAPWLPERRLMDDVRLGIATPQEDEFALCAATGLSPYMGWVFPRRHSHYDRYLTFRDVEAQEVDRWGAAFLHFARKLTYKDNRPLVLKSPPHTGRVRLLLDLFPDARFVHLRRDPYTVFQSTRHFERVAVPALALQRGAEPSDERILTRYAHLYDAYLDDRARIPAGRLHDLRFEELEVDPLAALRTLYDKLGVPNFEAARPAFERQLGEVTGYRKNEYHGLLPEERRKVAARWGRYFDAWGYPT